MALVDTRSRGRGRTPAQGARELGDVLERTGVACEVRLPGGETLRFGEGPPAFTASFKTEAALTAPLTEYNLASSYISADVDFEGDMGAMLAIRDHIPIGMTPALIARFAADLLMPPTWTNKRAIARHYTLGDDFYLTFIDRRYRFYSHCLFHDESESLEEAAEHKLETMWKALGLAPGMRLLDVGGGWGGVIQYCSPRGVHATSLTLVEDSENYIRRLMADQGLEGEVVRRDVLDYVPEKPFDHAVIYGVIEHIPNYGRLFSRLWDAIEPGGRLYFDASATKEKFAMSAVTRKYTWAGHHTFLSLQDAIRELLLHGFEVVEVKRETRDYELTISHWAQRLVMARDRIVEGWGEEVYRAFHIFLWGGAHAFATNRLQAYHVVAERRQDPGPRPGAARRIAGFLGSSF